RPRRRGRGDRPAAVGPEAAVARAGGGRNSRIPPALLGPLLVGGVFSLLVLGVVAVVLFAG
ncbi:hypothetical protein, partial [Streptomyces sp. CBMA123]|uniref:hypothetical protein n=1 Tax=Streptomyces sp. CBMA123 TaxID=1896313 RepID=UPI001CB83086